MSPAFSKVLQCQGGAVQLFMRGNSLWAPWQGAGVGAKGTRWFSVHTISALHLADKPILQLAEAAFRSSISWILGSDFLLPSRAPFAAIWSNASCGSAGAIIDYQWETRQFFQGVIKLVWRTSLFLFIFCIRKQIYKCVYIYIYVCMYVCMYIKRK